MGIIITNDLGEIGMPAAAEALCTGKSAVDILEAGIAPTEQDAAVPHVGIGGTPNLLGEVECDAIVIDGNTHQVGSIAGLRGYPEAFFLARQVLERSPHVCIGGEGAALFAQEVGLQPSEMLSDSERARYQEFAKECIPSDCDLQSPAAPRMQIVADHTGYTAQKDTVIYLVKDAAGNFAAGGSTSGWGYKHPGRYGDTPLPGAGLWADNEGGACGCTHTGEMTARCLTAKSVVDAMRRGIDIEAAVNDAVSELRRLQGGFQGQVVIYAISCNEEHYVFSTKSDDTIFYCLWSSTQPEIRSLRPKQ